MDYLCLLQIKDFQSLKQTEISLEPGLNVIVGPSNLGKSAAIRALKALVKNAPAPGLIRGGAKEFELTALFKDGDYIDLTKGKNKSEYRVNGELFAKAGATSVPTAVSDIWNIGDPDLTFASQHDKPFLLDVPASQVAHTLGELTNASVLMEAVQKANKLRTQAIADEKARSREAEEAREELLTHAGLTARTDAIKAAREAYEATDSLVDKWSHLIGLQTDYAGLLTELNTVQIVDTSILQIALSAAESAVDEWRALVDLNETYRTADILSKSLAIELSEINAEIAQLQEQIIETMGDTCPLCEQRIEHADRT